MRVGQSLTSLTVRKTSLGELSQNTETRTSDLFGEDGPDIGSLESFQGDSQG